MPVVLTYLFPRLAEPPVVGGEVEASSEAAVEMQGFQITPLRLRG
jgi:hypothetical protein